MTEVKVIKKYISVFAIQELIQCTDSLVDDICFLVPNYVDGVDFSDWSWRLYYKTSLNQGRVILTDSEYDAEKELVRVYWKPDRDVTKEGKSLELQLRASKDTENGMLKWNSAVAYINLGRAIAGHIPNQSDTLLEEYLDRFESLTQSGIGDMKVTAKALLSQVEDMKDEIDQTTEENRQIHSGVTDMKTSVEENVNLAFEYMLESQQAYRDTVELKEYLEQYTKKAYRTRIGNGSKTYTVTHSLNTESIIVQCWPTYGRELPHYVATRINNNILQLDFEDNIPTDGVDVVISAIDKSITNEIYIDDIVDVSFMSSEEILTILNGE